MSPVSSNSSSASTTSEADLVPLFALLAAFASLFSPILPCVTGHEIVGRVSAVGAKVTEFKKGDNVGVGAQVQSCGKCKQCTNHNEQYCQTKGKFPSLTGNSCSVSLGTS